MRFIATLVALAGSACASVASLQGARALPEGESRSTFAATAVGAAASDSVSVAPGLEYLYRGGLGEGFDYGFHAWPLGLALDLKQELVRDGAFRLAWAPAVGAAALLRLRGPDGSVRFDPVGSALAQVSLYATRSIGAHELTLAPRLVGQLQQAVLPGDAASSALLIGATLGGAIELSPGLRLLPELTALWVLASSGRFALASRGTPVEYGQGAFVLQAALGVAFGR